MRRTSRQGFLALLAGGIIAAGGAFAAVDSAERVPARSGPPGSPPIQAHDPVSRVSLPALARELEERASRVSQSARTSVGSYGPQEQALFEKIRRFSDRARAFHGRLEQGDLRDSGALRAEANGLLEDAHQIDNAVRETNVSREMLEEWRGVMRALQRLLNVVGT